MIFFTTQLFFYMLLLNFLYFWGLLYFSGQLNNSFYYKHKDKLQSNVSNQDDSIVLYTEGMSVNDLANKLNLDLFDIVNKKIDKNEKKYPIDKAKGNAKKYNQF